MNGAPHTRHDRVAHGWIPRKAALISGDRIACGGSHGRCFRLANPEDEITLTATPAPDAHLIGWTGACAPAGDAPTCTVTAVGAKTVSAVFGRAVEAAVPSREVSIRVASGFARTSLRDVTGGRVDSFPALSARP